MSTEPQGSSSQPLVLIAGAGIGGLMLGTLLERIGIPYVIFERASKVKPLGTRLWIEDFSCAITSKVGFTRLQVLHFHFLVFIDQSPQARL